MDKKAYILAKSYTDNSIKGISGVLAGKNATIKSQEYKDGVNTIVFQWTADDGTVRETQIEVHDGIPDADARISALEEWQDTVDEKLETVDSFDTRITAVEQASSESSEDIQDLSAELQTTSSSIANIGGRMTDVESDINDIKDKIDWTFDFED